MNPTRSPPSHVWMTLEGISIETRIGILERLCPKDRVDLPQDIRLFYVPSDGQLLHQ